MTSALASGKENHMPDLTIRTKQHCKTQSLSDKRLSHANRLAVLPSTLTPPSFRQNSVTNVTLATPFFVNAPRTNRIRGIFFEKGSCNGRHSCASRPDLSKSCLSYLSSTYPCIHCWSSYRKARYIVVCLFLRSILTTKHKVLALLKSQKNQRMGCDMFGQADI